MEKLININDLSKKILSLKKMKRKICLCHGVFDLIHIGHIRHFKECKKKSDVLIVSITADNFVNKGPDKPVFNERLRAEMLSSYDFVDFIIINKYETSINLINTIKPHFYGKGHEYKSHEKDVTGNISKEVDTVEKNGGRIIYTDEITFSSSKLLNILVPEKKEGLNRIFKKSLNKVYDEIIEGISMVNRFKVLFIGETIIDNYKFIEGVGKPPKEDIISTLIKSEKKYYGGVIAAAKHLQEFCKKVDVLTNIDDFRTINKINNKNYKILKINDDRFNKSITKTRYISNHFNKKLFETYDQLQTLNTNKFKLKMKSFLKTKIKDYDIVIVLDFGHGFLDDNFIKIIQNKSKYLALNVQTNSGNNGFNLFTKYSKADLLCIDHNELRLGTKKRLDDLDKIIKNINKKNNFKNLVITCGKDGSKSFSKEEKDINSLPTLTSNAVDTMGAGDAFISLASCFSKLGSNNSIVSLVGNIAGSLKVNILGHENYIKKSNFIKYLKGILI